MKKQSGMEMLRKAFQSKEKKHKKFWIAGAIKKPGALHSQLGIAQGKKIPAKTLARAGKKGGKLGRRARLAQTLKGFHSKKRKLGTEKWENLYEKETVKKRKMIKTPKSTMVKEHSHLVGVLNRGKKSELQKEEEKQEKELAGYKRAKRSKKKLQKKVKNCNK